VTSPIESPRPLSYRLPIVTFLLAPLVSEIFDLKVADTQTNPRNSTLCDNKGPLKLSAREPIISHLATVLLLCQLWELT